MLRAPAFELEFRTQHARTAVPPRLPARPVGSGRALLASELVPWLPPWLAPSPRGGWGLGLGCAVLAGCRPRLSQKFACLRSDSSGGALVATTVAAESEICPTVVTARSPLLLLRLAGAQQ